MKHNWDSIFIWEACFSLDRYCSFDLSDFLLEAHKEFSFSIGDRLLAISNFPGKRQAVINKVNKAVDEFAREVEEAMQKDLSETVSNMDTYINAVSRPYQEAAQRRLDKVLEIQKELSMAENQLRTLQVEIQNLHVS